MHIKAVVQALIWLFCFQLWIKIFLNWGLMLVEKIWRSSIFKTIQIQMKGNFKVRGYNVKESNDGDLPMPARKTFPQWCLAEKKSRTFWNIPNKISATDCNLCRLQQCSNDFSMIAASKHSILKLLDLLEQIFQSKCNTLKQSLLYKEYWYQWVSIPLLFSFSHTTW